MKKINLLIADDHPLVLTGLKSILSENSGFNVVAEVFDGRAALKAAGEMKIDLALLDIDMPILNGIETTIRMKKEFPSVKIIGISMHSEKGIIEKMLDSGASGYILKNASKEELVEGINKIMKGEIFLCSTSRLSLLKSSDESILLRNENIIDDSFLTRREIEILKMVSKGFTAREIAAKLYISHRTVETHRSNLIGKLKLKNVADLIQFAIRRGFV